jgi:hypothetical protein
MSRMVPPPTPVTASRNAAMNGWILQSGLFGTGYSEKREAGRV